jgi:hypothetical protein
MVATVADQGSPVHDLLQSPFPTRLGRIAGRGKPAVRPAST